MEKLSVLILVLVIVPAAIAQVTLDIYRFDGNTLSDFNDVMVGSQVTFNVSSDSGECWSGGLFISGQDRSFGTLSGRDLDPDTQDWAGSRYAAAGDPAKVTAWQDSAIWGLDFYTAIYNPESNSYIGNPTAGDWFVIDYTADEIGDCNVGFYDYNMSWSEPDYKISFYHTPTRDLNSDQTVNLVDFSIFASQWFNTGCSDPNWCDGADLDMDSIVDHNDLRFFASYWLWPDSQTQMMGQGDGMESGASQVYMQESLLLYPEEEIDIDEIDELVDRLEELWETDEGIRETYTEEEWQELIDSIKDS